MHKSFLTCLLFISVLSACNTVNTNESTSSYTFELIDLIVIGNDITKDSTVVGGLSSIDYMEDNQFVVISDDRSEYSPARIYEMEIDYNKQGIVQYDITKTAFLKNRKNALFEENELDPESIRYRASTDTYFYTSEGGRLSDWINPFIREMDREGELLHQVEVPEMFSFGENNGVRENGGFESLTFENDTIIWYANELPLKEDGEKPGFVKGIYPIRLVQQDIKNQKVLKHFVYTISHLDDRPVPSDGFYVNSVPEIFYIDKNKLWMMERSFTTGVGNVIRIFEVETSHATNVMDISSLQDKEYEAVSKKLILDLADYDLRLDNIEGLTFGPDFPDGTKSLLFISDNNFSDVQETQLWLFAVSGLE